MSALIILKAYLLAIVLWISSINWKMISKTIVEVVQPWGTPMDIQNQSEDQESYWADFNETYIWFRVCLEVFRNILDFGNCALKKFGLPLNILFVRNFKKFWWCVWHHKNLFFGVILKGFLNDFLENFVLFIRSPPYDLISVSPLVQTSLRPYLVIFYDFSIFASAY